MQKSYILFSFISVMLVFFGIMFLITGNTKVIFSLGTLSIGLFIAFTLGLLSYIYLKKSTFKEFIIFSFYIFFTILALGSLVVRYIFSLLTFSHFRHYMDTCFEVFFIGIGGIIIMILATILNILFFKKEENFK